MQNKQNNSRNTIIALAALIVLAAGLFGAYQLLRPTGEEGSKSVHIEIIVDGAVTNTYELRTDALYLRQALEEKELIKGEEQSYGLYIKTVDGVTADESKSEWWCFTKGGEMIMTGVDDTPVSDGDRYEITLTTGYDT